MSESIEKKAAAASNSGNEEPNAANAAKAQRNDSPRESVAHALGQQITQFPASYPGGITPDTLFDERTERIIRAQADKMVATGLFEQHERDDVENELRIVLACEMIKYDPAKDRYTFVATILAKRGVNAIIKRGNYLRDNPRPLSLDEPVNGESGVTFLDIIPAEDWRKQCAREARSAMALKRTNQLLDILSPQDRRICEAVMRGVSIREIASVEGMAVSSVHHRLRGIIAEQAREIGLGGEVTI